MPTDGADADTTSDSDGDPPDDSPLRKRLAEAVADLVVAVRAGSGGVASLHGLSKSDALEPGCPHYFRIQGKDFVFELDAAQENGAHVHTVWRNRRLDLGGEALAEHYRSRAHR